MKSEQTISKESRFLFSTEVDKSESGIVPKLKAGATTPNLADILIVIAS